MKKIFLVTVVAAFTFSMTACGGDSVDKVADDIVDTGIKCFKKEYDKKKCDELDKEITARAEKFSKEEQDEIKQKATKRLEAEVPRLLKEMWKKK